jgi:hypothetical protein
VSDDPLDYPRLVQRALVGVAREALRIVSNEGLPGEHHFFLAFRTDAPGVVLPARLRAQYPREMSIILQHLFWDLAVDEDRFSVTLRFGGAPEHLEVPFDALTVFADPSAHFGLRFDGGDAGAEPTAGNAGEGRPEASVPRASGPRPSVRPAAEPARSEPGRPRPVSAPAAHPSAAKRAPRKPAPGRPRPTPVPAPAGKKVVDLAAFRKASDKPEGE